MILLMLYVRSSKVAIAITNNVLVDCSCNTWNSFPLSSELSGSRSSHHGSNLCQIVTHVHERPLNASNYPVSCVGKAWVPDLVDASLWFTLYEAKRERKKRWLTSIGPANEPETAARSKSGSMSLRTCKSVDGQVESNLAKFTELGLVPMSLSACRFRHSVIILIYIESTQKLKDPGAPAILRTPLFSLGWSWRKPVVIRWRV